MIVDCKYCKGLGEIDSPFKDHPPIDCIHCNGTGVIDDPHARLRAVAPAPRKTFWQWTNSHDSPDWVFVLVVVIGIVVLVGVIAFLIVFADSWFILGCLVLALFAGAIRAYEQYRKEN